MVYELRYVNPPAVAVITQVPDLHLNTFDADNRLQCLCVWVLCCVECVWVYI